MIDIEAVSFVPEGKMWLLSPRRMVRTERGLEPEPIEEWAKRCAIITNIGGDQK